MSGELNVIGWKTDSTTQFRTTIAQNAGVDLDLPMAAPLNTAALAGINGDCRASLIALEIVSVENLAWEIWFWESATHGTAVLGTVNMLGRWSFNAGDGVQIGGAGDFFYYLDGLEIPIIDKDRTGKLHLTLVNRSAAGKSAGDSGAIQIRGHMVPHN